MLSPPTSFAADLVRPITPCFDAAYAATPWSPEIPAMLEVFTMLPPFSTTLSSALRQFIIPVKLVPRMRSQRSSVRALSTDGGCTIPALFAAPSGFLNFDTVFLIHSSTKAYFETSTTAVMTLTSSESLQMISAAASSSVSLMSAMEIFTPRAARYRAMA